MSNNIDVLELEDYFQEILQLIKKARSNALKSVNLELISLYWQVGEQISKKVENAEWGIGVVDKFADYLHRTQPDIKGFNRRGLYRMKQFYETYCGNEKVSSRLTQTKGLFGTFRNSTVHAPKIEWDLEEQDALDLFTLASYVLRRIDDCHKY